MTTTTQGRRFLPPVPLDDMSWYIDGNIVGARAEYGNLIHAGQVNVISDRLFSMSPLCFRYRKRNGERLAAHERGRYPMLVGSTRRPFREYVGAGDDRIGLPLCRYCVAVFGDMS
ncbi:MAG: hypothetical protein AB7G23_20965 [Vicinamibacterales bacterium]